MSVTAIKSFLFLYGGRKFAVFPRIFSAEKRLFECSEAGVFVSIQSYVVESVAEH